MLLARMSVLIEGEYTTRAVQCVGGHSFIRYESVAFECAVGFLNVNERIGVDFLLALRPEKLVGEDKLFIDVPYSHVSVEPPYFCVLKVFCRIALNGSGGLELLVELLQIQSFGEIPIGLRRFAVDLPQLGGNAILSDTGIAD